MEILWGILAIVVLAIILLALFEFRVRQPDTLVLYESKGKIGLRGGLFYPRHFSLLLKRAPHPIQLHIEGVAAGNLGVVIKLAGSVVPALDNLSALVRIGGWNSDAVARAAEQASIRLEGLVKEYTQQSEIQSLSSKGLSEYLEAQTADFRQRFGLEIISLAVVSLDPTDSEIAEALRQQEEARLMEQTERLNHQARIAAAKSKYQADEQIATMEHELELKKLALKKERLEQEDALAQKRLEDELARSRMRLAFEKEELDILKDNPELLLLTPQAARLAEASQRLKNARTIISLSPQDFAGTEWGELFQKLLQKAVEKKSG